MWGANSCASVLWLAGLTTVHTQSGDPHQPAVICIHVCVSVRLCACAGGGQREISLKHSPQSLSTLFLETESLTERGDQCYSYRMSGQQAHWGYEWQPLYPAPVGAGDLSSGPHVCMAKHFTNRVTSQPPVHCTGGKLRQSSPAATLLIHSMIGSQTTYASVLETSQSIGACRHAVASQNPHPVRRPPHLPT